MNIDLSLEGDIVDIEKITLFINIIMMIVSVISCSLAFKAKKDVLKIVTTLRLDEENTLISNSGENRGVIAKDINGGVKF